MLVDEPMSVSPHSPPYTPFSHARAALALAACLTLFTPLLVTGCKSAAAGTTTTAASAQAIEAAREQLDLIPPPSKNRYMAVHNLSTWENPYLTVQQNMATLHITLADANPSDIGAGGLLRPIGARQQALTIRISDLPSALDAVPENSWPYGRVVAVEEAHDTPSSDRPAVRRNVETTIKTLGDLGVVVYEWTDGGFR
jgi:hypothetical protein